MRNSAITRALVGILASAAFLWTLTLSVSPELHERIHPDANRPGHSCAVTMIASGNIDDSPPVTLIIAPTATDESRVPELTPCAVKPVFLLTAVFEHAPPA
jgi:hypothetical protein